MVNVTLPGSGKNAIVNIATGTDASAALTTAIKSLFTAAGKNTTYNPVASGVAGSSGFFNIVLENAASKVSASAGTGVQAIIDVGKGSDTLTGGASTTLIVGNAAGDSISTAATGVASVFGGVGSDTVKVGGKA